MMSGGLCAGVAAGNAANEAGAGRPAPLKTLESEDFSASRGRARPVCLLKMLESSPKSITQDAS